MSEMDKVEQQAARLASEAQSVLATAEDFKITTPAEYECSGDELKQIKSRQKELKSRKDEIVRPMNEALKRVRDLFRKPEQILEQAEVVIKREMARYSDEQEKKRRAEQARLEELARKERERKLEQARRAEEAGKAEKAAALAEQASTVVAPVAQAATPKAEGISYVETWHYEVIDASKVPDEYKVVDTKKVGAVVRALKGDARIPGIRVYSKKDVRSRAA